LTDQQEIEYLNYLEKQQEECVVSQENYEESWEEEEKENNNEEDEQENKYKHKINDLINKTKKISRLNVMPRMNVFRNITFQFDEEDN